MDPLGNWVTGLNRFTCGDGSGSVTARTWLVGVDYELVSSVGAWQILAGTGEYEELRGMGMHASSQPSGAVEDDATLGYSEAWSGRVAFDAMAPTLTVSRASASQGARDDYLIRVVSTRDNLGGNPVSFMLTTWSRFLLAAKSGTSSLGQSIDRRTDTLRRGGSKDPAEGRSVGPVGNEAALVRPLKLPLERAGDGRRSQSGRTSSTMARG